MQQPGRFNPPPRRDRSATITTWVIAGCISATMIVATVAVCAALLRWAF